MTFRDFVLLSTCILLRLLLRWPAIFKAQPKIPREDLISRSPNLGPHTTKEYFMETLP